MSKKYNLMQVVSGWSKEEYCWKKEDSILVGTLDLPERDPVESDAFSELLRVEEIPLMVKERINRYGSRVIEVMAMDGQALYTLIGVEAEPEKTED